MSSLGGYWRHTSNKMLHIEKILDKMFRSLPLNQGYCLSISFRFTEIFQMIIA